MFMALVLLLLAGTGRVVLAKGPGIDGKIRTTTDARTKQMTLTLELEPLSDGDSIWIGIGLSISVIRGRPDVVAVVGTSEAGDPSCRGGFALQAGGEKVALGRIRDSGGGEGQMIGEPGEVLSVFTHSFEANISVEELRRIGHTKGSKVSGRICERPFTLRDRWQPFGRSSTGCRTSRAAQS
jgi:hypothetical protein